eukprot:GFUD01038657.1.p1 GENE.GFUD01038657.1~~GFUD01038657.1.p1  ORF type:complete len:207 (+),score=42.11 GFUD01038657.1:43-663(+)
MAAARPDSLDMFDSMDIVDDETGDNHPKVVPLHELSSAQLNCLDPYRDDPKTEHLKPAILKDYLGESSTNRIQAQFDGLDPTDYCQCGQCTSKPTLEESSCCKSIKTSTRPGCITEDAFVEMILNPVMLEISLRNVWSIGKEEKEDESLSNKNFRYAAYRNLFFFLYKKNTRKKNIRTALPSCLVDMVRRKYPEVMGEEYVGFLKK